MEQYRSRLKLSENFERHWSILISGESHMDQSLVHTFSWGNSYGPMVLKVLLKFHPRLALVHGWLFPVIPILKQKNARVSFPVGMVNRGPKSMLDFCLFFGEGQTDRLGVGQIGNLPVLLGNSSSESPEVTELKYCKIHFEQAELCREQPRQRIIGKRY